MRTKYQIYLETTGNMLPRKNYVTLKKIFWEAFLQSDFRQENFFNKNVYFWVMKVFSCAISLKNELN